MAGERSPGTRRSGPTGPCSRQSAETVGQVPAPASVGSGEGFEDYLLKQVEAKMKNLSRVVANLETAHAASAQASAEASTNASLDRSHLESGLGLVTESKEHAWDQQEPTEVGEAETMKLLQSQLADRLQELFQAENIENLAEEAYVQAHSPERSTIQIGAVRQRVSEMETRLRR